MMFAVKIGDKQVLLDAKQLEKLVTLVDGAAYLHDKWVGTGNGTKGSSKEYRPSLEGFITHEHLSIAPVSDDFINAIKFIDANQKA